MNFSEIRGLKMKTNENRGEKRKVGWRECVGIEPTQDGISAPRWI